MKKKMLIALLVLLFTICVKAQELKFGLMTGLNNTTFRISNVSGNSFSSVTINSAISYHINAVVEFRSDSWWGVTLEPGYIKKGGSLDLTYLKGSAIAYSQNSFEYANIQLPVLLNIYLGQKFYLSTGLSFDYSISSSDNNRYRALFIPNYEILPVMNNKLFCSAQLGISYELTKKYDIGIRYEYGLTKLVDVNLIKGLTNSVYQDCIQLSLKYNI